MPAAAFREVSLVAGDPQDARVVFRTSGTTGGESRRGAHYVIDGRKWWLYRRLLYWK